LKTILKHIASIQTGVFARTVTQGEVVYLQSRHFDEYGELCSVLHPDLKMDSITDKHLLRNGDVLFAAKGAKNFAAVYESHNPQAVASTTFFVIRLHDNSMQPHYLAWLLNNPVSQSFLKRNALGSSIASISKTVLEELEITVPSLHIQECILEIVRLGKKENALLLKIAGLRQMQIQQHINNIIKYKNG
jgi:hypothetical protein